MVCLRLTPAGKNDHARPTAIQSPGNSSLEQARDAQHDRRRECQHADAQDEADEGQRRFSDQADEVA